MNLVLKCSNSLELIAAANGVNGLFGVQLGLLWHARAWRLAGMLLSRTKATSVAAGIDRHVSLHLVPGDQHSSDMCLRRRQTPVAIANVRRGDPHRRPHGDLTCNLGMVPAITWPTACSCYRQINVCECNIQQSRGRRIVSAVSYQDFLNHRLYTNAPWNSSLSAVCWASNDELMMMMTMNPNATLPHYS